MPNRILFVIGAAKSGGAEKRAINIASLLKDKFDTKIFAFYGKKEESIDFVFKPTYDEYKKCSLKKKISGLSSFVKETKPDVIVSFVPHVSFLTHLSISKVKNRPKHVVSMVYYKYSGLTNLIVKYLNKKADGVYYQSICEFSNYPTKKKYIILPNPLGEYVEEQIVHSNKPLKFIAVGRLSQQKNYPFLIDAFKLVVNKYNNSILEIYGEGEQKDSLMKLIANKGLEKNIKIFNYVDDISSKYNQNDIFLSASTGEGFPNALLESMNHYLLPIVKRFDSGCNELIINEKTGFVFDGANAIDFGNFILDCIQNFDIETIRKNAHKHVTNLCNREKFINDFNDFLMTEILYEN